MLEKGLFSQPLFVHALQTNTQSHEVCIHVNLSHIWTTLTIDAGFWCSVVSYVCLWAAFLVSSGCSYTNRRRGWLALCVPGEFAPATAGALMPLVSAENLTRGFRNPSEFCTNVRCRLKCLRLLAKMTCRFAMLIQRLYTWFFLLEMIPCELAVLDLWCWLA